MNRAKQVVVRSSQSGVWIGVLASSEPDGPGTVRVALTGARRIWSWQGAGSCSGLAAYGPRSGRIAPPIEAVIGGCCEVLTATSEAIAAIEQIAEWRP